MSPARPRQLPNFLLCALACLASLMTCPSVTVGEEVTLLTIEGNLIGKIEDLKHDIDSEQLIEAYYELLSRELREEVEILHSHLVALIPDYEVAFTAADSAEITEVKSDIDVLWAGIRTIHASHFTPEVAGLLNTAYDSTFSTLDLKPVAAGKEK